LIIDPPQNCPSESFLADLEIKAACQGASLIEAETPPIILGVGAIELGAWENATAGCKHNKAASVKENANRISLTQTPLVLQILKLLHTWF
jgi:hypothetical protein